MTPENAEEPAAARGTPGALAAYRCVLEDATLLHSSEAVDQALARMAAEITDRLGDRDPLILVVMLGGLVPAGRLLSRLNFALEIDYVHATRYRGGVKGRELQWFSRPVTVLRGRSVLVVDDILDEGVTLAAILEFCREGGAAQVSSAVLVDKQHRRERSFARADFTGLMIEDRYVFGCGMDYRGYFRNLPAIYAVKGL